MGRNTELIRVRKDILRELTKDKKKGESYSDVLDKWKKIKVEVK